MRDYTDRQVNQPMQVTSPTWGPSPPCKQALNQMLFCRSRCRRRRRYLRSNIHWQGKQATQSEYGRCIMLSECLLAKT